VHKDRDEAGVKLKNDDLDSNAPDQSEIALVLMISSMILSLKAVINSFPMLCLPLRI
jgi:hypothetical protein